MTRSIFRYILFGILAGAALFFFGFILLRIFLVVLIVGAIIRFFTWRRWRGGYYSRYHSFHHAYHNDIDSRYSSTVIELSRKHSNNNIISID